MARLNRPAHIYWEGTIAVKYAFPENEKEFHQYYVNKCPGDCHKCTDICPNKAITFRSMEEAWDSKVLIDIDEEKCIRCGGCMLVCPQDNYHVKWTNILISGPYNEIFWNPIKEKLMNRTLILSGKIRKPNNDTNLNIGGSEDYLKNIEESMGDINKDEVSQEPQE